MTSARRKGYIGESFSGKIFSPRGRFSDRRGVVSRDEQRIKGGGGRIIKNNPLLLGHIIYIYKDIIITYNKIYIVCGFYWTSAHPGGLAARDRTIMPAVNILLLLYNKCIYRTRYYSVNNTDPPRSPRPLVYRNDRRLQ